MARDASASRQRTGDSSTPAKSSRSRPPAGSGAFTEPIWVTWETTSTPRASRKALASAPPATRAAVSRALARSSTLRTSVKPYFWTPARSACPGRGRWTSGTAASTGHGFIRSRQFSKSRLATERAIGPPSVRPCRTPEVTSAASRSIFMRPPRPWPSWRRAMSALIACGWSSSPAGRPSTMQVSPGPCDSPAVIRRSDTPASLGRCGVGLEVGLGDLGRLGDHGLQRLAGQLLELAGPLVVAVAQGPVAGDAGADDLAARGGAAGEAARGLLRRRRDRLVDLDHVELVLGRRGGVRRGVVRALGGHVEELRVALLELDRLARAARRLAGPVALGDDARVDHEHRGLAVLEHAEVDEHRVVRRRQRLEALDVLAGERGFRAGPEADRELVELVLLLRRDGGHRGREGGRRGRRASGRARGAGGGHPARATGAARVAAAAGARGARDAGGADGAGGPAAT